MLLEALLGENKPGSQTTSPSSPPPPSSPLSLPLPLPSPLLPSLPSPSPLLPSLQVNGFNMVNATHAEAVAALKSVTTSCQLVVSREVLVVLPEDVAAEEEEEQIQQDLPPTPSPTPKEEEDESGEGVAKKMVAAILDRSLKRCEISQMKLPCQC